jgi:hypothetical protein
MGNARCLALIKLFFDLFYICTVFAVYLTTNFQFMDKFNIGVYNILKKEKYLDSSLYKEIEVNFRDFEDNLCDGSEDKLTRPVCENREHFEDAGILYITFTVISHFLVVYSIAGMLGIVCKCSSLGVATVQVVHYLYPALHGSALIMYLTVSRMFNLTTPSGYSWSKYGTSVSTGFILMIIAQLLSFTSLLLFILSRRSFILLQKRPKVQEDPQPVLRRRSNS